MGGEAGTIIAEGEDELVFVGGEFDIYFLSLAVFDAIAEGFLGDAIEVGGGGIVVEGDGFGADEAAGDLEHFGAAGDEVAEGGDEAAGFGGDGVEAAGEASGEGDGFFEEFGDAGSGGDFGVAAFG